MQKSMLDRNSPSIAEEVFHRLLPERNVRLLCLKFMAESAVLANSVGPNRWGITLGQNGKMVRLNFGSIEVLAFFENLIHCVVDHDKIPGTIRNVSDVEFYLPDSGEARGIYSTVPCSEICNFAARLAPKMLPALRPAHDSLIRASDRPLNPSARKSHSHGVIAFLRKETGISLNNPGYFVSSKSDSVETYLLKSNTKKYPWPALEEAILAVRKKGSFESGWSCGVTKRIRRGDRIFLMRTGETPRGIMGAGVAIGEAYEGAHFDQDRQNTALYVDVRFDSLLDPKQEILAIDNLKSPHLADFPWHTQNSGVRIPGAGAAELEKAWSEFLGNRGLRPIQSADEVVSPARFLEGVARQVYVNVYERNPYARQVCIDHYGSICFVCGFEFEKFFGNLGAGYIHVHHLKSLAEIRKEYEIDPIADLRPVCPNCHAMLHRMDPMMSIEDLKSRISSPNGKRRKGVSH